MSAAVQGNFGAPPKNGKLYTEEDWNETSTIEKGQAYHLSKAKTPPLLVSETAVLGHTYLLKSQGMV